MYEQSFFERIVNSGTLVVESAGEDGQQVFRDIPNADETQQLINRLVEGDHDRRSRNAARYEAAVRGALRRGVPRRRAGGRPGPADPPDGAALTRVDHPRVSARSPGSAPSVTGR